MGLGSSKKIKVVSEEPRNTETPLDIRRKCLECQRFTELRGKQREEFIKYAESQGRVAERNRLQFWFDSQDVGQLETFLTPFLVGEMQLPASDFKSIKKEISNPDVLLKRASELDGAIQAIQESMRSELDKFFDEFKKHLNDKV